ncbi:MAG TPA: DNA-formamidopyrimidine glycosylase family protein [Acidimicrobiales bacterium]|nr:DNA-formamidopyrimidine glycosylase family protein [Acidimicrobiales bacterium]
MPEMPELQAHAERLTAEFSGAALSGFRPITFTALKTATPDPATAYGHVLVSVGRRGKYLLLDFDVATFVVHLMQGGRIVPDEKQSAKPRGGQARWTFADGRALLLTEAGTERRAGVWVMSGDVDQQAPLSRLGPDADALDAATLLGRLHTENTRLHGFLRDQGRIAGVGRRLANEICHRAKLSPFAMTKKLTATEADVLLAAIDVCIEESLDFERGRDSMSKSADRPGSVHHRDGEACPVCNDEIRAVEYRSYTVNYCPTCQTGGKVLADNTTSRFLK